MTQPQDQATLIDSIQRSRHHDRPVIATPFSGYPLSHVGGDISSAFSLARDAVVHRLESSGYTNIALDYEIALRSDLQKAMLMNLVERAERSARR